MHCDLATGDFEEAHTRCIQLPQFDPDDYAVLLSALNLVIMRAELGSDGDLAFTKKGSMLQWVAQVRDQSLRPVTCPDSTVVPYHILSERMIRPLYHHL